jgi:hypothetical protein
MKKSEMINIIADCLMWRRKDDMGAYDIAAQILKEVEDGGMYPPDSRRYRPAVDLNWEPEEGFPENRKKKREFQPL